MEQSYKEIADRHAETHPSPWAYPPETGAAWPLRSGLGVKAVTHLLHPEGAGRLG